jgi:hypothetical protein
MEAQVLPMEDLGEVVVPNPSADLAQQMGAARRGLQRICHFLTTPI